jgi:hypothetical protein
MEPVFDLSALQRKDIDHHHDAAKLGSVSVAKYTLDKKVMEP